MAKIVCFEGVHGSGKATIIASFLEELKKYQYAGKCEVIRDSEYPAFEQVKQDIRSGVLTDKREIIEVVASTRAQIYEEHINARLQELDLVLLDRSYYTSAVWQSETDEEMYHILHENERRGIPQADLTFVLYVPISVIGERLRSRNRSDVGEHDLDKIAENQRKYMHLAKHRDECFPVSTENDPVILGRDAYTVISAIIAL